MTTTIGGVLYRIVQRPLDEHQCLSCHFFVPRVTGKVRRCKHPTFALRHGRCPGREFTPGGDMAAFVLEELEEVDI